MKCYKCNSLISPDKDICSRCGSDLRIYKKIIYNSNYYYNQGLTQAKGRDLSGAIESLKLALQLNKNNTDARNLLGLVYYEMGEAAMAVKEWNISKNFQYRNNIAESYLQELMGDPQMLDEIEHSIRKYNQALESARTGARDLAIVQLKKVISVNQRMIKAYQLLALLYIEDKKCDQAKETLRQCLEADKGNELALSYMEELGGIRQTEEVSPDIRKNIKEQVITPVHFRDYGTYFGSALCILLGAAIALGILCYLVIPSKEKEYQQKNIDNLSAYEQSVQDLNTQLVEKDGAITQMQENIAQLEVEKEELAKNSGTDGQKVALEGYDSLLGVLQSYCVGNWLSVKENFPKLDKEQIKKIDDTSYQTAYEALKTAYVSTLSKNMVQTGDEKMKLDVPKYEDAVELYAASIDLDTKNGRELQPGAVYGVGEAYAHLGQIEQGRHYYELTIQKYPGTEWAEKAEKGLEQLG